MNRQIKFRGKDIDTGKWVYGGVYVYNDTATILHHHGNNLMQHTEVAPDTVGQFTGLHDIEKKEVYEGDLIELDAHEIGLDKVVGEVQWNNDGTLDGLCYGLWTDKGWHHTDFLGTIKLLGNIHEKP